MSPRRRRPYWLLLAFVAVAAAPLPWLAPALAAGAVAVTLLRTARFLARIRSHPASAQASQSILLGSDSRGSAAAVSEHELAAHGLILGASGAGKTTTLLRILTELIARGRPVVAIDLKGSPGFARSLQQAAEAAGRPFALWTPDGPGHWNPLRHGNATELKDKLIATERFTEPHYQRAAERYVQNVFQVLQATGNGRAAELTSIRDPAPYSSPGSDLSSPGSAPTLAQVVELMDPHRLRGALRRVPAPLRTRVEDYLSGLTGDQVSAIRGLQTRLAILTESHTGRFLAPAPGAPGIDLRAALSGPDVVLFSLNSSRYGRLAGQLGTLAVQDLVCAAGHRLDQQARGLMPQQGFIVIDEVSVLGGDHVLALFARGREAGLGVLAATQELADLDRAAAGLRDQVLGNTAVKLAHRQEVPASAQTIAQLAGTEKAWEETQQVGGPFLTGLRTGRGTRRQSEQFIVHPNEVKALRTGEAVLISKLRGDRARTIRIQPGRSGPELG